MRLQQIERTGVELQLTHAGAHVSCHVREFRIYFNDGGS